MGNEGSAYKDCTLLEEVPTVSKNHWTLYKARRKEGTRLSVFVYIDSAEKTNYIQNAAKFLKVLKHPSVIKFHSLETIDEEAGDIWLITEQVMPLESVLETLTPAEICAGIYNILEALIFLHDRGGLCHNNISLSSIFVSSEDGSWKLGGMEYLCRFEQATTCYLQKCRPLRNEHALAPEEKVAGQLVVPKALAHARDSYAFGAVAEQLLEYLGQLGDLTKTFALRVQDECLNSDPRDRPKLSTFLNDRLFKNDFTAIINFLKNITLKTADEKKEFFCGVVPKLYRLPVSLVSHRLVRLMLSRFVLLDPTACQHLIPHILTPWQGTERRGDYSEDAVNPLLPVPQFKRHVIPEIFKIFHVRDAHIRMVLLTHFHAYVGLFDAQVLHEVMLPQVLLGLRDSSDELVAASLRAVACMVPLLGGDVVIGAHRAKIFKEGTPKFGGQSKSTAVVGLEADGDTVQQNGSIHYNQPLKAGKKDMTLKEVAQQVEKERRRDEAKKRSEDRRRRREERRLNPVKAELVDSDSRSASVSTDSSPVHHVHSPTAGDSPTDTSGIINDIADRNARAACSDSEDEEEESASRSSSSSSSDGVIDREIEEELRAMDSTASPRKQKDPNPAERLSPEVRVDWSNAPQREARRSDRKGVLKLKAEKTKTSPPPNRSTRGDEQDEAGSDSEVPGHRSTGRRRSASGSSRGGDDTGWNDNWGVDSSKDNSQWEHVSSPANKGRLPSASPSKDKTSQKNERTNSSTSQNNKSSGMTLEKLEATRTWTKRDEKPLGSEYDIMCLDIKAVKSPTSAQMDFFADMQPKLQARQGRGLWDMLQGDRAGSRTSESGNSPQRDAHANKGLDFAVTGDPAEEAADGWGDEDLSWGVEDN